MERDDVLNRETRKKNNNMRNWAHMVYIYLFCGSDFREKLNPILMITIKKGNDLDFGDNRLTGYSTQSACMYIIHKFYFIDPHRYEIGENKY